MLGEEGGTRGGLRVRREVGAREGGGRGEHSAREGEEIGTEARGFGEGGTRRGQGAAGL